MPDENNAPPADPNAAQPPAGSPPQNPGGAPASNSQADPVELAKKLGELEAENKALKDYQQKVDPVLQTIWSDQELLKTTTAKHNERLGIVSDDPQDKKDPKDTPPPPSKIEQDNRAALITQVVGQFNESHGYSKMTPEQQADFNQRVGMALQEMLDPMGNKTLKQIMEDVSVTKLPKFLDNAHHIAFKDEIITQAKEQGNKEAQDNNLGMIGSMASTSVDVEQITLTPAQKKAAHNMGVTEEQYLKNVKEIAARNNQLF